MRIKPVWLYILAVALLAPALLINLGVLTFIDDEGIRSLVALEMDLSGNWVTPTLHGSYYYKKPPLYNWILLGWYQLTGAVTEFNARFTTVVFLCMYAFGVFWVIRRRYDTRFAFLAAFMLITCGRILFWDSMLALIDTCFSGVIFLLFMVVFHKMEKEQWLQLFIWSYLLCAIGFLLKGLPAIVFQGITLLAYFSYKRQFRRLFSRQHILGGLIFLMIVGGYYLLYHQYNSLENVFTTLFTESSKRTVVNFSIWETALHLLAFPFEMIYHFLPWSLMIIFCMRKDILRVIAGDPFLVFCAIIFLANILIYWTSPEVYPRYLLMLVPLIFTVFLYLHDIHKAENSLVYRIWDRLMLAVCVAVAIGSWSPLFLEQTREVAYLIPKTLSVAIPISLLPFLYWRNPSQRIPVLILFLLLFRIGFNFFVLPDRNRNDYGDLVRKGAITTSTTYLDQPMYVYKDSKVEPAVSFYLTNTRQQIIHRKYESFDKEAIYIISPMQYPNLEYDKIGELRLRHGRPIFDIGILK